MKNLSFILILLTITTIVTGQSISPVTKKHVAEIAKVNEVHCAGVGYVNSTSDQFKTYNKLCKTATDEELIALTSHSNQAVRCYAFQCLSYRPKIDLFTILLSHLNDIESVSILCGCIGGDYYVGDYLIQFMTTQYFKSDSNLLSFNQRNVLDSILIFQDGIVLKEKKALLLKLSPKASYYNRIRQLAKKEDYAIVPLAKYKKKEDIETIKNALQNKDHEFYGLVSVKEFPDSAFLPILVRMFEREWKKKNYTSSIWKPLFEALANYPQPETYNLFNKVTELKEDYPYQNLCTYLALAIYRYPNELYESLTTKIVLDKFHQDLLKKYLEYSDN